MTKKKVISVIGLNGEPVTMEIKQESPLENVSAAPVPPDYELHPLTIGKKSKQTSFDVLNSGGDAVRTYTVETHGEEAEANAREYAKKIGGSVA